MHALVLDGAIDPTIGTAARRLVQFVGFQRVFDNMAAFYAKTPDCSLGTDLAHATAVFQRLHEPLEDEPITTADGRTLTSSAAMSGVMLPLDSEEGRPASSWASSRSRPGAVVSCPTASSHYAPDIAVFCWSKSLFPSGSVISVEIPQGWCSSGGRSSPFVFNSA